MPLLVLFSYDFWVPEGHPIDFQKLNQPFLKINSYFSPHPHTWLYGQLSKSPIHFLAKIGCISFFGIQDFGKIINRYQ
jgi:hypothetical protein